MGNRLSKIYTRTGDAGSTGLGDGSRVDKDGAQVEAFGAVDECNSAIGVLRAYLAHAEVDACLEKVQHQLFDLGGELCMPGHQFIKPEQVSWLEQQLDGFNDSLPPLREFILPNGPPVVAHAHLARTICRRAERRLWTLHRQQPLQPPLLQYLNRLSDLLFVIARVLAQAAAASEVMWDHERR
ncbi:MAG: cob(I)yrinic acid a,c-diamide adenosyltransferase [Gammaproteobacteria bacterium]|nr:cob(I)yrinic acid a,c-diamide adenosyltransferase [Gammaproteobacteria bacterium]